MSESAQAVTETERLSTLYEALIELNQSIARVTSRDQLLELVCRILVEKGGFRLAWVGWHDPITEALLPVAQWGNPPGYVDSIRVYADDRPEGRGPSGSAFREGRPSVANAILDERGALPWHTALERAGMRAGAAFPIRENGTVRGTLAIYSEQVGFFRDKEIQLLTQAADSISFALDNLAREAAREQAEQKLRHERDFSDAVLSSLPGVLYMYDREGKFMRWNENFERATGYTHAEIASMHPLDFFSESDSARATFRINEVFENGASDLDAGLVSKSGSVSPYHFTGVATRIDGQSCLIGVGIDISERKRAESARQTSDARYRVLFEHAPDGIVIADRHSYYVDANASICRMLGYTRQELIGMHALDIVVESDVPRIAPALIAIEARSDYHQEWRFRRKDGTTFPAEVIATLMPDGNLLGMIRDITERKAAEAILRESNEDLERKVVARTQELQAALVRAEAADRVKSAFLATMSHELRTPLNSIIGFTGIVLQGMAGPLTSEQSKQLGMVKGSARHLLELINDVLDLSKIEAGQLVVEAEPFELRASIERVLESMRPLADKKGLALAAVVSPELGEMHSDRRRVEQILLNLLSNAIKFTERGSVRLTAEPVESHRPPLSPSAVPLRAVRIQVADTGVGVGSEDLAALFQPFRQLDTGIARQHEGTGLGLAICRKLTTLLGGEISVFSERSKGSRFTVTLPLHGPSSA